jgi:CubicO group peptidase (beta-lactamase class C family)
VRVPGVAVGVAVGDERSFWCDGITSVDNPMPIDERTLFQLGSVSKVVTATAAMALVEAGALELSDLVAGLLPDVDLGAANSSLTVEHLLTHRGGWQGDWSLFNAPPGRERGALRQMVRQAASVPRYADPGGPFSYDNFGTCVLGAVIEQVADAPFDVAIRDLALDPLALHDSVYWADDAIWGRVAVGHDNNGQLARGTEPWADVWPTRRAIWPQGGLVASVTDALAFADFHATGTAPNPDCAPLRPTTRRRMQVQKASSGGQGTGVAIGWHVRYASGEVILTHTGAGQGCFARIVVVPSRGSAFVALTNGADGPAVVDATFDWYLREVLGIELDHPIHVPAPGNAASLLGEYRAVTRTITVQAVEGDLLTAEVVDTGPTWGGTETLRQHFCEDARLVSDRAGMEYGTLNDGRAWLRYRGRVHVRH